MTSSRPAPPKSYPGKLRIIGGRYRGRRLSVMESEGLRPTPDRVRETLFNWLAPVIEGARCLDLFAGTGALCLESLSRGASEVVMVERAPKVAATLREQVLALGAEGARVVCADAMDYLMGAVERFDVVFLDPPFASPLIGPAARLLATRGWLASGAMVYVEAPVALDPLPLPDHWEIARSRSAGAVGYHLVRTPRVPD